MPTIKDPDGTVLNIPDSLVNSEGEIQDADAYSKIKEHHNKTKGAPGKMLDKSALSDDPGVYNDPYRGQPEGGLVLPYSRDMNTMKYVADGLNAASLALTPELGGFVGKSIETMGAKAIPYLLKTLGVPMGAGYLADQGAQELGVSPETSQVIGDVTGLGAQSPKLMNFASGFGKGFTTPGYRKVGASFLLDRVGSHIAHGAGLDSGPAEVIGGLAAMTPEIPDAIKSGVSSSQGKNWLGPALKSVGKDTIPGPDEATPQKSLPGYKTTEQGPANLKMLPAPQKLLGPASSIQQPPNDFFNRSETIPTYKDPLENKVIEQKSTSKKQPESNKKTPEETNTPKIISRSEVEQFANDNGVSVEEAEKQFKDHTILDKSKMNRALHGLGSEKGMTHEDLSDYASARFSVDSLSKLTDKQLHQIHQELSDLPNKSLQRRTKSGGFSKKGTPATKDTLLEDLENSLKKK